MPLEFFHTTRNEGQKQRFLRDYKRNVEDARSLHDKQNPILVQLIKELKNDDTDCIFPRLIDCRNAVERVIRKKLDSLRVPTNNFDFGNTEGGGPIPPVPVPDLPPLPKPPKRVPDLPKDPNPDGPH